MSNGRIFLALLPALLLLLPVPTGPALAARQPAERLLTSTSGLLLANPSAATACSVLATEQNPAALIAVQGAEATFLYVDSDGGPGGGAGFFFGLPLTSFWVPAVALQWLDRTVPVDRAASKTTLSSAFGTPAVAFGVNYSFFGSGDAQVDKLHAWDIGLLGRPWRWLSMAAVARNANGADLGQTSLPVVWDLGLALRPLTWRVTFNGDVLLADRQGEQADVLQEARFGLRLHPLPSLQLEASLGVDGGGLTTAGFAIGFSEEVVSLQGQTIRDARSGSDFESLASGALAQLHAAHRPPLVQFRRAQTVELTLSGSYPEPKPSGLFAPSGRTFSSLLADLRRLRTDRRIGTLLLRISDLEIGLAQAEELRQALTDLRQRGILVHAHLEDSTTTTYYLASAADIITMTPGSELLLLGLSTTFTYLGDALARLRVQPEFVRIGRYKTAPNTFTEQRMPEEEREMEEALLDDLYTRLVQGIALARRKSPEELKRLIDGGPYLAESAREAGLVDGMSHYAEVKRRLQQQGTHFFGDYFAELRWQPAWGQLPRLAIVHASGVISSGPSSDVPLGLQVAGAPSLCEALDQAAGDGSVKAIVLRIDSPGGSASASEVIHFHVAEAAKKKPVIVSMGATAASGGYYIAAPATAIYADPSTLTGSIGIFAGKFDVSGLLGWLGVQRTTLRRGERADLLGVDRPFSEQESQVLRDRLQEAYDLFVLRVAQGRRLTLEQAQAAAQGRVWTGEQALRLKLVDRLGGLSDALLEARRRAGLSPDEEVELVELPVARGLLASLELAAAEQPRPAAVLAGALHGLLARQDPAAVVARQLLGELSWLPAALLGLQPGEPLALLETLVEVGGRPR